MSTGRQNRKKARKILDSITQIQGKILLTKILKQRPSAIINAHEGLMRSGRMRALDDLELIKIIKDGRRIDAIKLRREQTGEILGDAHTYIKMLASQIEQKEI